MTDLDRLIAAWEAGTFGKPTNWRDFMAVGRDNAIYAHRTFYGDMNAALALRKALVPGWRMVSMRDRVTIWEVVLYPDDSDIPPLGLGEGPNPARALGLAVLKAHRAQLDAKP